MSQVYILQNQHQQFLSKQMDWVDGRDANGLYKTPHKDEALNQMFEVNAKDFNQRIKVLNCPTNPKGIPQLRADLLPPITLNQAPDSESDTELDSIKQDYEGSESQYSEKPPIEQNIILEQYEN